MMKSISQRPSGAQCFDGRAFPGLRCAPPVAIFQHPSGVNYDAARSVFGLVGRCDSAPGFFAKQLRDGEIALGVVLDRFRVECLPSRFRAVVSHPFRDDAAERMGHPMLVQLQAVSDPESREQRSENRDQRSEVRSQETAAGAPRLLASSSRHLGHWPQGPRSEREVVTGGVEKAGEIIPSARAALRRAPGPRQAGLRTVFCTFGIGHASRKRRFL
jgi:hypothetical protein